MASSECKNYHQARRPSYDRAEKAREQLMFGNARVSGPAAQQHLEHAKATDEAWRRDTYSTTTTTTDDTEPSSTMHGYGDSWFENLTALTAEYHRQKAQVVAKTPAISHGYGDAWFENLNHQREDYEHLKSEEEEQQHRRPHYYGQTWFGNYEQQWAEWKNIHTGTAVIPRKNDFDLDSDDESCELGQ